MAIWEQPQILSGESAEVTAGAKAELALCIPHTENITMEWAIRLKTLQLPPYRQFFNRGMPFDVAREQMTRAALSHKDTKMILFLDSDNTLPPDGFLKLKAISEQKNLDIVSALYWAKKREGNFPAAWQIGKKEGNKLQFLSLDITEHIKKGTILQVGVVGLGACLVRRSVFDRLDKANPHKPFFCWGLGRDKEQFKTGEPLPQTSEDFFFCLRCVEELKIYPHVATSVRADHIAWARKNRDDGHLELLEI